MEKVFVVGCPRSGTSIFQKALSDEFLLWTMPETGYFTKDLRSLRGRLSALTALYRKINNREKLGDVCDLLLAVSFFLIKNPGGFVRALFGERAAVDFFDGFFSGKAKLNNAQGWLEKTPNHFRNVDKISDFFPDAKVFFVVRDGRDVAASIYDRYLKYPDFFEKESSPLYGAKLWNESLEFCERFMKKDNVFVIPYDDFVEDKSGIVSWVASVCALNRDGEKGKFEVSSDYEKWKSDVGLGVKKPEKKYETVFSKDELTSVEEILDYSTYQRVMDEAERNYAGKRR